MLVRFKTHYDNITGDRSKFSLSCLSLTDLFVYMSFIYYIFLIMTYVCCDGTTDLPTDQQPHNDQIACCHLFVIHLLNSRHSLLSRYKSRHIR